MKRQDQLAKIEEIKNIPIVNIMDAGRPAARKEKPKRSVIVFVSFFLAAFGVMSFVYLQNRYADKMLAVQSFLAHAYHRGSNK